MPSAGPLAVTAGSTTRRGRGAAPRRGRGSAPAPVRVAVLGAGTVGREVIRALQAGSEAVRPSGSTEPGVQLAGVAVRVMDRARELGIPDELLTDAPAHLVAADDTDVVVELMGGDEPARTLILAALNAGKDVVTANKHVLAHHGPELEAAARGSGAALRFEAAVGGGIPVLAGLAAGLAGNRIDRVRGIVNGTTNHILSALADGAGTYESVLRDAQQRGYAEADPSGDVEGRDAVNKLVVLARLAFGRWLDPTGIEVRPPRLRGIGGPGITGVTADQLTGASAVGMTIKLIASAGRSGERLEASVVPTAVGHDSLLGRTGGVRNRIEISGTPIGLVGFDGPGAGGPATSSAVLADLLAVARGEGSTWTGSPPPIVVDGQRSDDTDRRRAQHVARRWFLLLPGVRRRRDLDNVTEAAAPVAGGLAVRTTWLGLETLRSRVLAASPATLDAPCYPVDDD